MDNSQHNNLAGKIEKVIGEEARPYDLAALARSIARLNERLHRLESAALQSNVVPFPMAIHPSRERFEIPEDTIQLASAVSQEKICTFEPNEPPCDHCSMCTARGF